MCLIVGVSQHVTEITISLYSEFIIFASVGPYYCAKASYVKAVTACMYYPILIDVDDLLQQTASWEASGDIDPTSNLRDDRVFVFSGLLDTIIFQGTAPCGSLRNY